MAKSKTMKKIKKEDLAVVKRMSPSEKLKLALELSGFSVKLMLAGMEAKKLAARKKS